MSSRTKQQHSVGRFQTLESMLECPDTTLPFTFSTTVCVYAATEGVSAHRRHAGDRATTVLGGVPYYGYRYYNPDLGRWISRDPIGETGGLNLYWIIGNRVIDEVELYGLDAYEDNKKKRRKLRKHLSKNAGTMTPAEITTFKNKIQDLTKLIDETEHWNECVQFEFYWIERFQLPFNLAYRSKPIPFKLGTPQPKKYKGKGFCTEWVLMGEINAKDDPDCRDVAQAIKNKKQNLPVNVRIIAEFNSASKTINFHTPFAQYAGKLRRNSAQIKQGETEIESPTIKLKKHVVRKVTKLPSITFK